MLVLTETGRRTAAIYYLDYNVWMYMLSSFQGKKGEFLSTFQEFLVKNDQMTRAGLFLAAFRYAVLTAGQTLHFPYGGKVLLHAKTIAEKE